jgi:type VI protein secretion system component VasA
MKYSFLILLFVAPLVTNAQQDAQDIEKISKERAEILLMIDSLNTRLTEINKILKVQSPEDRLAEMKAKYGKNKGKMIADGKVWSSIDYQMAIDSWGEPIDKKTTETSSGTTERWNYPNGHYLFFKNGRLETWK